MTRTDDSLDSDQHHDHVPVTSLPAAVLWDMDGTLVDTEPYWFAAERDVVERYGHGDWPDKHAHAMVGFDLLDSAAYMQEHGGVDLPAEEIVERLLDGVIARLHRKIPWRPGARELLADLNEQGVPCGLVTMSWRRFAEPVLAALPARSFAATVTGDEVPVGRGKPHPDPYEIGARALGFDPRDCIAIEDSPTGVRSAVQAQCQVIGVPNVKQLDLEPGLTIIDTLDGLAATDLTEIVNSNSLSASPHSDPAATRWLIIAALIVATVGLVAWAVTRSNDEPAPPPLPPGAVAVDVWAPFWTLSDTLPVTDGRFGVAREVSPFWFAARGADQIVADENAPVDASTDFIARVRASGARLVPSINDEMPATGMAGVLADPVTRAQHIEAIRSFATEVDADGIDLDYERFAFSDGRDTWPTTRPNWVAFVSELAAGLHSDGRTLTVSVPPVWGLSNADGDPTIESAEGFWVYDHVAIAEHVDAIRVMAYDYSFNEVGPIAPTWWVTDIVTTMTNLVPAEYHHKLVLGVGTYGRNWVTSTLGTCPPSAEETTSVFARTVNDLAARRNGTPVFDPVTSEWSFQYALSVTANTSECIQHREVRWVDAEGAAQRAEIARRAGWGGVALWALGYEDTEVWDALVGASQGPLPAVAVDGS